MLGIAPDSIIGVHVSRVRLRALRARRRPASDRAAARRATTAICASTALTRRTPWEHWANSGAARDGTLQNGWLLVACRQGRAGAGRAFRDALHDAARDGLHRRGGERRAALVPAPLLHQAALALYRTRALRQHVQRQRHPAGGALADRSAQEAHPVFAAYMDMRYSSNMARDEARAKVIPTYMGLIKQIDDQMGVLMRFLESAALARYHDDRVHLGSWRLSRRSLDGREGSVPRAVGENPADRDRSHRARPTRRAAPSAMRWSRRSISRRPSSTILAASCRTIFSRAAR